MRRTIYILIYSLLLLVGMLVGARATALAGGWATITLDSLPVEPRAGTKIELRVYFAKFELLPQFWGG